MIDPRSYEEEHIVLCSILREMIRPSWSGLSLRSVFLKLLFGWGCRLPLKAVPF